MGSRRERTRTTVQIPQPIRGALERLIPEAEAAARRVPSEPFPGPFFAPVPEFAFQAPQQALGIAGAVPTQPFAAAIGDLALRQARGEFLRPESNPFLPAVIEAAMAPTLEAFSEQILPRIETAAIRAGAFGGARDQLLRAQAARDVTREIGRLASQIAFENFARERALQQAAPQLLSAGLASALAGPEAILRAAEAERALRDVAVQEALARFQEQVAAPFRPIIPLAEILQGVNLGQTQIAVGPAGPSRGSRIGSGALTGALTGATAGALVGGPVGAVIGGVGGALFGGISGAL